MKRVMMLVVAVMALCGVEVGRVRGEIVEVSSFSYLREVINTRGEKTIILSTSTVEERGFSLGAIFSCCYKDIDEEMLLPTIVSRGHHGSVGIGLKEIYGNDVILDGRGRWAGVKVGFGGFSGNELKIRDVTMRRFYPYRDRSGDMVGEMRGGAIYLEGANVEVSGRVNFENNEAEKGGGIYAGYCLGYPLFEIPQGRSGVNFSSAIVNFVNNKAGYGFGGGIYVDERGEVKFNMSRINFEGNKGEKGGGIYGGNNCRIEVEESEVNFINNEANRWGAHGGGVCIENGTRWESNRSTMNFIGNKAGGFGGGMRALKSRINIVRSNVNYEMNESMFGGGICVDRRGRIFDDNNGDNPATIVRVENSEIRFRGNRAEIAGGGIYVEEGGEVVFGDRVVEFENNVASGNGGAICAVNSRVKLSGEIRLINNEGGERGGGIYLEGGMLNIETLRDKVTEFRGNKASGKSNAIHMEGNAVVRFEIGENGIVNMNDAITSRGLGGRVDIVGEGRFNLDSEEKTIIENLNIRDRVEFCVGRGAQLDVERSMAIEEGAAFNAVNGGENIISVGEYVQEGKLRMEIFGGEEGEEWGRSDKIICGGRVRLGERSGLEIQENGYCRDKSYMLIRYGSLEGRFGSVLAGNHEVEYGYEGKWIVLLPIEEELEGEIEAGNLESCNINGSKKGIIDKERLSRNEKEVGEKLSCLWGRQGDIRDIEKKTAIRILRGLEEEEKKKALSETSGYFISNVIMSQMLENSGKEEYRHIEMKEACKEACKEEISNRVWGKVKGVKIDIESSENSPGELEVNKGAIVGGIDIVRKEEAMVGVMCKFERDRIKQEENKGEVKNNGVGIYGGMRKRDIELKALLLGSISEYEMRREIRLGMEEEAKGDTSGINGELDMEVGYNIGRGGIKVRPYVGVNTKVIGMKGYKEEGTYPLRLEVEGKEYVRSKARTGVEVRGMMKDFGWNVRGGVNYALIGSEMEIGSKIIGTEVEMKTKGAEVGEVEVRGEVGGAYRITNRVKAYADVNISKANKYRDIACNLGIRYFF